MKHIIKSQQFEPEGLLEIFKSVKKYDAMSDWPYTAGNTLEGKTLASLFYEPSTRTRFSFETAMHMLGGSVISTENAAEFSSTAKGESLEDTIKVVSSYADLIVLRHPKEGASERAAAVSSCPIINAGDGAGQHPTQSIIDMYAIWKQFGSFEGLNIVLAGDVMHSRTVHSLIYLLSQFDIEHLYLVSPEHNNAALVPAIPQGLHEHLVESGTSFTTHNTLEIASLADVIYMTRSQTERRDSLDKLPAVLTLTKRVADLMPDSCIVLHPLPRLTEIPTWFDSDPRAKYFEQAAAGVAVRAVLMQCALEVYSYIPSGGTVSEALITDTMVNSI